MDIIMWSVCARSLQLITLMESISSWSCKVHLMNRLQCLIRDLALNDQGTPWAGFGKKSSPSGGLICEIPPIKKRLTALNTQMETITEKHSIYILTSLREGLRYQPFSTSILSPVRKFVALSNAGRRRSEKCARGMVLIIRCQTPRRPLTGSMCSRSSVYPPVKKHTWCSVFSV